MIETRYCLGGPFSNLIIDKTKGNDQRTGYTCSGVFDENIPPNRDFPPKPINPEDSYHPDLF